MTILNHLYFMEEADIGVHTILQPQERNRNDKQWNSVISPRVILTSSGMCDKGSVLKHLERTLGDAKNTILLTGYQAKGSNGHILSELSQMDEKQKSQCYIQLEKNSMKATSVKANISKIGGYFGHADQKSLINYLFTDEIDKHYTVPNIFLNHGDNYARETLKNAIYSHYDLLQEKYDDTNLYHTNVEIPKLDNKCYDLDRQCWIDNDIDLEQVLQNLIRSNLAS